MFYSILMSNKTLSIKFSINIIYWHKLRFEYYVSSASNDNLF